jgi:hypothetical protein
MKVHFLFSNSLVPSHKPVNFLIRWVDKSCAGHFAIGLETDYSFYVYEAVAPKVRKVRYEHWVKQYEVCKKASIDVPRPLSPDVVYWLENIIGTRYGYEQVILLGVLALLKPLDLIFKKININHKRALICTEIGSRFIEKFLVYSLKESHDKIGVRDMELITDKLFLSEILWQKQT